MIDSFHATLPHGVTLACRAVGPAGAPVLLFLHGFPEAAFVWDGMLRHFGSRYRCIAPNLRGYAGSSAPMDVQAYRAKHLVADVVALIDQLGGRVEALVAHDWGGALAWNLAAQHPDKLARLVILNAPHPATFLRALQHDAAQQKASAYMSFLCRPDAAALLAENDFARLWPFLTGWAGGDPNRIGWLTEEVRAQYRAVWRAGLVGPCHYYAASPLRPPQGPDSPVMQIALPPEAVTVRLPTTVVWAEDDTALLPVLLDGLDAFVPQLRLVRVPGATHWIVHEQPARVAAEIDAALAGVPSC
jgi:epoxide hydrolase 4